MNKNMIVKHREAILWFINNPDKELLIRSFRNSKWSVTTNPKFNTQYEYIPNDIYVEFRKAEADGKQIFYLNQPMRAFDRFNRSLQGYSILKFQPGDWIRTLASGASEEHIIGLIKKDFTIKIFEPYSSYTSSIETSTLKWEPKYNEWCVFWNSNQQSYRIAKFKQIAYGSGREGQYKDQQQNYYINAAPLEFIQILKGNK